MKEKEFKKLFCRFDPMERSGGYSLQKTFEDETLEAKIVHSLSDLIDRIRNLLSSIFTRR